MFFIRIEWFFSLFLIEILLIMKELRFMAVIIFVVFVIHSIKSQVVFQVDTSVKYQVVKGFGGSLKRHSKDLYTSSQSIITTIENLVFNELHINMIRVMCHPSIEPVNDNGSATYLDTSQLDWIYYENTTKDIYAIQRAKTVSNGRIDYIIGSNNSAPAWQKANNNINWGDTILWYMYDEFTEYLSAFLRGMKHRYGITINAISPFNEPGIKTYYESLTSSKHQVKQIVKKLRQRLDGLENLGLLHHVDIISPDCIAVSDTTYVTPNIWFDIGDLSVKNTIYYVDSALNGLNNDVHTRNSYDILGTHNYFDENNTADWQTLKQISYNKPIWVTEAATFNSNDFSIYDAIKQAKWIHRSFTQANARVFMMHSLYEPVVNGKTSGLVAWDGNTVIVPKRYYGFKQFVNFIHPGYFRVEMTGNYPNLYGSAYLSDNADTLVVVIINDSPNDYTNVLVNVPKSSQKILHYATSDTMNLNCTKLNEINPPSGGQFNAPLLKHSINTFKLILDSPSGLTFKNYETDYIIYPNPVKEQFYIKNLIESTNYDLYDSSGKLIKSGIIYPAKPENINDIKPGMYYLKINGKKLGVLKIGN